MATTRIPLFILGGSDREANVLRRAGEGRRLSGYKGVDIQIGGRPLIAHLIERLRTCPELHPIRIAGPARIYEEIDPTVAVLDTDRTFAENIRAVVEAFLADHAEGPLAVATCDILPDPAELRAFLDDYHRQGACDVWYPLIRAPKDPDALGAFAWKPKYHVVPERGAAPVLVLPCHLMIGDPRALRLRLLHQLFDVAYRTRNRPIAPRHRRMARRVLLGLLYQDLVHLLTLRVPSLTWTILRNGLRVASKLRAGTLLRSELEKAATRVVVRSRHRRRFPDRGVALPLFDGLTLAEDIDTEEEARELERAWERRERPRVGG